MQPGYGIPELQQFMVDGSALFTLSNDLNPSSQQKHPHHLQLQQQHQQQQQQQQQQNRGYQYHHQFQPFLEFQSLQQPARWLHPPPPPSSPPQPPPPPPPPHLVLESQPDNPPSRLLPFISSFRPLVDTSEPGCSRERHHFPDEDVSLADEAADRRWPREEGAARSPTNSVRGPVWRLSDSIHNINSRAAATTTTNNSTKRYRKGGEENEPPESKSSSTTSYRMFSELEAIYNVGFSGDLQAGSGSALTGDNPPPPMAKPSMVPEMAAAHVDFASETSADEEGSLKKIQNVQQQQQHQQQKAKKKKRKKQQQKLASIAAFFERLVNQIMEHQEALHRRFMEVMERRDRERQSREEEWRRQEAARLTREKSLRAQEEAAAASREAAIVTFLEKITGETLRLPKREAGSHESGAQPEASDTDRRNDGSEGGNNQNSNNSIRRWPKSEVNALIKVRSGFERRFQEPGLKGPLWEEVSSAMAALGYERSAKRCKEKWENINKYFRKAKNTGKRRPGQRSKTCPYFHQLDLLYTGKASSGDENLAAGGPPSRSELLDAIFPVEGGRNDKEAEPSNFGLITRQTARKMGRNIKKLGLLNCSAKDQNIDQDEEEGREGEDDEQEGDGDEEEEEEEEEEAEEEEEEEEGEEGEKRNEEGENAQSASFMELVHNLTANSAGTTATATFQDDDGSGGGRAKNIDFSMRPSTSRLI
ncbi:trihelix transcription factor GT-2-like [Nymphaea colorata]|nr:trihelix transcription factor GT-2-like [Nymphaea colorata]